jgi:hypothetical protein
VLGSRFRDPPQEFTLSEFETQELTGSEPVKPEREGLPPGYRMRADSHYVELLSSNARADRPRPEGRPSRELDAAQAVARTPRDRRVFDHLIEEISAIESAAVMLAGDSSALSRRVSLDLIKAQSARASWLLRSQSFLAGPAPDAVPRTRPVGALLGHIRDRIASECRLVGVGLQVAAENAATVTVDETAVTLGVTGAVLALLPLLSGTDGTLIRIEAIVEEDGDEDDLQAIEISQDPVSLSLTARQRFFEADWLDRPGGWLAATGASVAQAASERLGGRATIATGSRRGCTIRLAFA